MKIRKGDKVRVIAGKDRGQEGTIERIYEKKNKIVIQGINMVKRHMKKSQELPQGGIIDVPRPLNLSNVMVLCGKCKKPTRIQFKTEKGKKIRVCSKCDAELNTPKSKK